MSDTCLQPGCDDRPTRPPQLCEFHWVAVRQATDELRPPPGAHLGAVACRIADRHGLVLFDRVAAAAADCQTAGWPPQPQKVAVLLAALAPAADEAMTSLAGDFNDAATRYTDARRAGLSTVGPQAILDDLFLIRELLVRCGVTADGDADLELGSRYSTVTDAPAARGAAARIRAVQRRSRRQFAYRSLWSELLDVPGVTGLRWRTLAEHTAYIADLQATAAPTQGGPCAA